MHKGTTKYRDSSKRAERVTQRCCTDRATFFFCFLFGVIYAGFKTTKAWLPSQASLQYSS